MRDDGLRERDARKRAFDLRGMARRLVIGMTKASGLWQLLGLEDADGNVEKFNNVEEFSGVGYRARPRSGKGEAVVIHIGGEGGHPIVVATRDKSIEVEIDEDETVIFNSTGCLVKITKDGHVELGEAGVAPLPTAGVAKGSTKDCYGVPLLSGGVSTKVFTK